MNKFIFIMLLSLFFVFVGSANAKMYECTYKNDNGSTVVSSYNTLIFDQPNHEKLVNALRTGNCKELIVKRYFIDGTICNIQFYKYNNKIGNLTCNGNKESALIKLKEIARKDYGYFGH